MATVLNYNYTYSNYCFRIFKEIPFILVHGVKVKEWTIKGQSTHEAEVKGDAVITGLVNTAKEQYTRVSGSRWGGVEKRVTKIGRALGGNVVAFYSPIEICMEIWNSTFPLSKRVRV